MVLDLCMTSQITCLVFKRLRKRMRHCVVAGSLRPLSPETRPLAGVHLELCVLLLVNGADDIYTSLLPILPSTNAHVDT